MRKLFYFVVCGVLAACGSVGDDGDDGDDAPATPTAFRFTDLDLRDPHAYVQVGTCSDYTDSFVNNEIQSSVENDNDNPADGVLDLSPTVVFRPLNQDPGSRGMQVYFASCTAPLAGTMCSPDLAEAPIAATATTMASGTCLEPETGTTTAMYSPQATTPSGPCFFSDAQTINVNLSGIPIMLRDARVAATYDGSPATGMTSGLLIGFLTEADADSTIVNLPFLGDRPLSSVLPGGTGDCASHDDRDSHGGSMGWWFYLNFTAAVVPWSDT